MRHARADYERFQDPAGIIPDDEPVFLLRGQDRFAPGALRHYAHLLYARGHGDSEMSRSVLAHAERMDAWQLLHGSKTPDTPEALPNPGNSNATKRNGPADQGEAGELAHV